MAEGTFPIPSSFQDLERSPYNLIPYPIGFEDNDEATRAESFDELIAFIQTGNGILKSGGAALFETPVGEEGFDEWCDQERIQALYTLVRKSSSLSLIAKTKLTTVLCQALTLLSSILNASSSTQTNGTQAEMNGNNVLPQAFRDAFACHLYMLYTIMFFNESEAKAQKSLANTGPAAPGRKKKISTKEKEKKAQAECFQNSRESCARAMLTAVKAMWENKSTLWKRGVPDENVVSLPCRISYQMLETATGVIARKLSSGDVALQIIALTVDQADSLLGTIVAALVDLLHSFEHIAPLAAELCCMVSHEPTNKLALELFREIGHLNVSGSSASDATGKASGIRYIAPFIHELAALQPKFVLKHISLVLPHLQTESYNLRSSIVAAIGHVLIKCTDQDSDDNENELYNEQEGEESLNTKNNMSEKRENMFDILTERSHDTSSFTRGMVLKTWATLIEKHSLPIKRLIPVTALAIDRLQDKTVNVRRSAMQILTLVLENNPFTDSLSPDPYKKKAREIKQYILENMSEELKLATEEALQELDEDADANEHEEIETAAIKSAIAESETSLSSEEKEKEFDTKTNALVFVQSAIDFIELFESANAAFESMLLSSNNSDVTEALRFFVRARQFNLPCAVTGIKQALSLMWSNEKNIQDEVLSAFVEVFVAVPGTNGDELLPANKIVHNLLVLANSATVSELACIEEALGRLVKDEIIPADVFLILWSIAAKAPGKARSAAMLLLSMGASTDKSIVDSASRLRHLLEAGLGDYTEENKDWATAKSAACALQRISRAKPDPNSAKFIVLDQILDRLSIIVQGIWCDDTKVEDTKAWFGAAEQSINAIFVICPAPDQVARAIIQSMERLTFGFGDGTPTTSCHSLRLSRFLFVVSHIALKLLIYSEALSGSLRKASAAKSVSKQEQVDKAKINRNANNDSDNEDDIEAELGVTQAAEAENEAKAADIAEKEIISRGLIGLFTPLLVRIVANEGGQFSSEILMQTSTLALCKFMCVSRSFCEKYLPLLFSTLSKTPKSDITLRANTVIALGDLAFRFPNEVEPYTPLIYACLRDDSTRVRRHTLMVLTHLILNDMVKVKGQVCEIALCLCDDEVRIRDMARLLFHELSKRSNNPIYNLLPDIVSRLSNMSTIRKEDFRSIMLFLLGFIKKDRQNEMLVDKLCQRFPKCSSISQKADIAYCLAQLKITEKSLKILSDQFKLYKDALFDDDVHKNFAMIVTKAKKFAKPEMKQFVEQFESKLQEHSAIGLENQVADQKALKAKKKAAKRKPLKQPRRTTKEWEDESGDEDSTKSSGDEEEDDSMGESEMEDEFEFDEKENEAPSMRSSNVVKKGLGNRKIQRSRRAAFA